MQRCSASHSCFFINLCPICQQYLYNLVMSFTSRMENNRITQKGGINICAFSDCLINEPCIAFCCTNKKFLVSAFFARV